MTRLIALAGMAGMALLAQACGNAASRGPAHRVEAVYDDATGRLLVLEYDADNDGRIDTWAHLQDARIVRLEVDSDADGAADRREDASSGTAASVIEAAASAGITAAVVPVRPPAGADR